MPRPSAQTLRAQLAQCQHDLAFLANDPEWSGQNPVIVPRALSIELPKVAESARYVVVIVFYTQDPGAIRRILSTRAPSVLLRVRWTSSEALLILSGDVTEYCATIGPMINNAGLAATIYATTYSGNIPMDEARAFQSHATINVRVEEKTS